MNIVKIIYCIIFLSLTSSCTISTPLFGYKKKEIAKLDKAIVAITYTEVSENDEQYRKFSSTASKTLDQVKSYDGLLGYKFRRGILGDNRRYTLTIWKSRNSLQEFVDSRQHQQATELKPTMLNSKVIILEASPDEIPFSWSKIDKILQLKP